MKPPAKAPDKQPVAKIEPTKVTAQKARQDALAATRLKWPARWPMALGMLALVVLVGGLGSWAFFTQISGAIIASGQVEVERNRQVVQHPDGGVVTDILVTEGDRVQEGDPLILLDTVLLRGRLTTARGQLFELLARQARLEAERDDTSEIDFSALIAFAGDAPELPKLMEGQVNLFQARRETRVQLVAQLEGRRAQINRQIDGITAQRNALEVQLGLIQQELEDQQSLLDQGLTQASRVSSLRREEARLLGQVGELEAAAGEAAERISEIDVQLLTLNVQRREEAITELRDLQFREVEFRERVTSLDEQLSRTTITAPVSGVVYGLTIFAERSVLRPADPILYIVPQDRPLIIAAQVDPIHIDQVDVGQQVTVRLSAFDARTTPELFGTVTQVSADSFTDEGSRLSFYRAQVALNPGEIERLPPDRVLIPGMPVETFLQTENRTPIAYLVKPLADYFNRAFRES